METILLFILLGLGSGALIAGIALGVVVTYRGSGIINLSTGAISMLGGYAFWSLNSGTFASLPIWVAVLLALLFVLVVGAVTEFVVYRPLRNSSPLAKLVASLGVLLVAQAAVLLKFGVTAQPAASILPTTPLHLLGGVITVDRFILTGLVIVVAAGLTAVYKWTRFGLATRAAAENEVGAMLGGLSPSTISLVNTLMAALIAGALGILASSITQLDPSTLPLQIIPALAAALVASFTSFGLACGAAIGIGVLDSLLEYASTKSWFPQSGGVPLPGAPDLLAFLIIIGVLFWRGAKIPGRGEVLERRLPEAPRPQHLWRSALIFGGGAAVLLVVFPYDYRNALINTLIGILMALSLVVITGYVGQISVIQLSLAGAAGFTVSHMFVNYGITFPVAALAGIAVAVVIGIITAFSAVRVRGVSLAVVTLAGAVAIENFGFQNTTWGGGGTGSPVPDPRWFGLSLGTSSGFRGIDGNVPSPVFGWVVLACCVLLCVAVGYVRRGRLGQQMLAIRSNERAAAAAAVNPRTVKLYAFTISAFIAGVAGVLYAYNFGSVSADRFDAFTALSLIAFAYAGGISLISGAVFAGLISTQGIIQHLLQDKAHLSGNWFLLFAGVILIFTLLQNPTGVAGDFYRRLHKRPQVTAPDARGGAERPARPARKDFAARKSVLALTGLSVAFGGVKAVQDVSLEVRDGELVGLIGPNGAGKTTLVDAVTGFVSFTGGVELDGADISRLPAYGRSRRGLARTWQSTELFDDLDVTENLTVAAALRSPVRGSTAPGSLVRAGTGNGSSAREDAARTLALVSMDWAAEVMPSGLSAGQRKLVGVARALVARPHVLLLDEPAAGLDTAESAELGATLRDLADQGQSMLLIEHDMGLVMSICDRVIVLEFGKVIADGPPEAVRADPRVIAAYLGDAGAAQVAGAAQLGAHEAVTADQGDS